jgi:hypothetical protein
MARGFAREAGHRAAVRAIQVRRGDKSALLGGEIDIYQDKADLLPADAPPSGDVVPIVTLYHRRLTEVPEMKERALHRGEGINFTQGSWRGYASRRERPRGVKFLETC